MHISLDSALGRQRRLNSVGESVLQIAPNAAAAYSLRSLTGGDPKVVRVRRGSNNVESDFTASGVSSGALLDFVTTPQIGWNAQPTFSNAAGTGSVTSQSSTATTATVSFTGEASLIRETSKPNHVLGSSGDQVIFNISVSGLDSAGTLRLRTSGTNTSVGSSSVSNGNNQDITLNLTGSAGYLAMTFVASSGGTITFNSIKVLPKSGFVETWYDQSGNSNDAVQETKVSQPKIVIDGSLISKGLDFDGTDDFLQLDAALGATDAQSIFGVVELDALDGSTELILDNRDGGGDGSAYLAASNQFRYLFDSNSPLAQLSASTDTSLVSAFKTSSDVAIGIDGGTLDTASNTETLSVTTAPRIGSRSFSSGALFFSGEIAELVLYNTDKSADRTAVETNIANHYNITLV